MVTLRPVPSDRVPPASAADCAEVPYSAFAVRGEDPHGFDGGGDIVGCEE